MSIMRTNGGDGLPPGFPFSLAAEASGICFISGMPSVGEDGRYAPGTIREEIETAWRNVARIIDAAGGSADRILYVQCVLADISAYDELNDWWRTQFPDPSAAPARFTYQAGALPFGAKVELQAVIARGG